MALFECLTLDYKHKHKITIKKGETKIVHTFKHCNIFHFIKALKESGWEVIAYKEILCCNVKG
jgi:hypothetical protein